MYTDQVGCLLSASHMTCKDILEQSCCRTTLTPAPEVGLTVQETLGSLAWGLFSSLVQVPAPAGMGRHSRTKHWRRSCRTKTKRLGVWEAVDLGLSCVWGCLGMRKPCAEAEEEELEEEAAAKQDPIRLSERTQTQGFGLIRSFGFRALFGFRSFFVFFD